MDKDGGAAIDSVQTTTRRQSSKKGTNSADKDEQNASLDGSKGELARSIDQPQNMKQPRRLSDKRVGKRRNQNDEQNQSAIDAIQSANEFDVSKNDELNKTKQERIDQNFSPDMSSEQLDKNRRSGRGKTQNNRQAQNQEGEDEMATSDDKNQRRARRVSAKIKNNESSDLEVTNVSKG